ncbi:anthranilate phosphoribosyltransferase [Candidatus Geothermarchaeota archaeon ex4572_27]|nr:MAG: anthranilate phosphoribosyltransferase [Candidatus Geothermarchaeota archaeon ex4572_27]
MELGPSKGAIRTAIELLASKRAVPSQLLEGCLNEIASGGASDTQIGAFLMGLAMKGVEVDELATIARWMRSRALPVRPKVYKELIDTCGTGGGALTFNVSTANAIAAAAAGIPVAKHGSRSISHGSGSADVLEALGVNINLTPRQAERLIEEVGFAFLYAPLFHPMMNKVLKHESELGVKTVFYTVIGPLINPAGVRRHVLGVYRKELVEPIAEVLAELGYARALVVHGLDGLDEISNVGPTLIAEVRDGRLRDTYVVEPEEMGVRKAKLSEIRPEEDNPKHNADIILRIFSGVERGARRDFLLVNLSGSLVVGGLAKDLRDGVELARSVIDSGAAMKKLNEVIKASRSVGGVDEA